MFYYVLVYLVPVYGEVLFLEIKLMFLFLILTEWHLHDLLNSFVDMTQSSNSW